MQRPVCGVPRIYLSRTRVNKCKREGQGCYAPAHGSTCFKQAALYAALKLFTAYHRLDPIGISDEYFGVSWVYLPARLGSHLAVEIVKLATGWYRTTGVYLSEGIIELGLKASVKRSWETKVCYGLLKSADLLCCSSDDHVEARVGAVAGRVGSGALHGGGPDRESAA